MDIDAVEEGSKILVLDDSCLLNSSADLRNVLKVNSLDGKVVLFFFLFGDGNTFGSIDCLVHLEAQEVFDFDGLCKASITLPFSITFTTIGK